MTYFVVPGKQKHYVSNVFSILCPYSVMLLNASTVTPNQQIISRRHVVSKLTALPKLLRGCQSGQLSHQLLLQTELVHRESLQLPLSPLRATEGADGLRYGPSVSVDVAALFPRGRGELARSLIIQ